MAIWFRLVPRELYNAWAAGKQANRQQARTDELTSETVEYKRANCREANDRRREHLPCCIGLSGIGMLWCRASTEFQASCLW
ncbi:hypothetical protein PLESTM_001198600 [Pleodorina starrii]|nr:hypothetical protein PLESTM_001198600 [Pleodorina starrii]